MIAFVKMHHNFEEAFSASELLPSIAEEGRGIDVDIVAIALAGVEELQIDFVVFGEALVDGRNEVLLERVFFDIFAYLLYFLDDLLDLVREGRRQDVLHFKGVQIWLVSVGGVDGLGLALGGRPRLNLTHRRLNTRILLILTTANQSSLLVMSKRALLEVYREAMLICRKEGGKYLVLE